MQEARAHEQGEQARCCGEEATLPAPPAMLNTVARKRAGRKGTAAGMPDHVPLLQVDRIQRCAREARELCDMQACCRLGRKRSKRLVPGDGFPSRTYREGYTVPAPEDRAGRKWPRDTLDPLGKGGHRRGATRARPAFPPPSGQTRCTGRAGAGRHAPHTRAGAGIGALPPPLPSPFSSTGARRGARGPA